MEVVLMANDVTGGLGQLRTAALRRRTATLFKGMSTDYLLREQFVTEPSQILAEYVRREEIEPEQASAVDYFVYAVMSDDGVLRSLATYAQELGGADPAPDDLYAHLFAAVIENQA